MPISDSVNFLPPYLQTVANKRFLAGTLDLLTKSPQLTRFDGYIGRQIYQGAVQSGNYLLESTPLRQEYQLEAAFITRDSNQNIVGIANFIDLLNSAANLDAVTSTWNRLLTNNMYSWRGFVDLDKIINFQNYYWIATSGNSWYWDNSILIQPTNSVQIDIIGQESYTDPTGIILMNGMIINFPTTEDAPYNTGASYIVEGVGTEITLVPVSNIVTPSFVLDQNNPPDYITINRDAVDLNLWSRTNLWVNKNTVSYIIQILSSQNSNYAIPTVFTLANRPIIEFAPLVLFNSGKIGLPATTYFDNYTTDAFYIVQGQSSFVVDGYQLNDGDSVIFNADHNPTVRENIYDVNFVDPTLSTQIPRLYPVQAASTVNLSLYGPAVVDDYVTNVGDRILVLNQNNPTQNGIYNVSNGHWTLASDYVIANNSNFGVLILYGITYRQTYMTFQPSSSLSDYIYVSGSLGGQTSLGGIQDGVNKVFTLPITPFEDSLVLWDNTPLIPNITPLAGYNSYTISGSTITFTNAPAIGDNLYYQALLSTSTPITVPSAGIPLGVANGINRVFNMGVFPVEGTLLVWNNKLLIPDVDYIVAGSAIDYTVAPASTDHLYYMCLVSNALAPIVPVGLPFNGQLNGIQNSVNRTFTMTETGNAIPNINSLIVWDNVPMIPNIDYIVDGNQIIFNTPPGPTDNLYYQTFTSGYSLTNAPVIQLTLRNTAVNNNSSLITNGNVYANQMAAWDSAYWYIASQNKTAINQSPSFDVFDLSGNSFGNLTVYPGSSFKGSELFSYEVGTGTNDPILGFPLTYGPVGNLNDVIFDNNYNTDTFSYSGITTTQPIYSGRAHLINPITSNENIFDAWQYVDCNLELYQNLISIGSSSITFGGNLLIKSTPNSQKTQVFVDGTQLPESLFTVTQNANNTITINIVDGVQSTDTVVIKILSTTPIPGAWYDVPPAFDHNPLGQLLTTFNMGELRLHATTSQENVDDSTGIVNLFLNEYKGTPGSILFQEALAMLPSLLMCNNQFSIDQALRTAGEDYTLFKQKFINLATQLTNIQSLTAKQAVDLILQKIAASYISGQPWATSDMCYCGGSEKTTTVTNVNANQFNLQQTYDFTEPNLLELQVYQNNQQLIIGQQYTVTGNVLTITNQLNLQDVINIYEIANTTGSYIPATPTKLGLYNSYVPQIYMDYTYQTPRMVLQGHDGSITTCYGDYRDNLLLEYELRVFNNLKVNNQLMSDIIQYHVPTGGRWRSEQASTNASIAPYTPAQLLVILQRMFYEWAAEYNVNYTNSFYNPNDLFTWNWSSSLDKLSDHEPLLGYWRGIYRWFYDTEYVNTKPWESLNLSIKPNWWEPTYGPAPYTGANEVLWNDIENGIVRDPAGIRPSPFGNRIFSSNNVLQVLPVDASGNLLDPNESVVGVFNNSSAQNDFVFGDGGPTEEAWRRSSSFPFSQIRAQILQNPLFMCGVLWDTNNYLPTVGLNQFRYDRNYLGNINQVTLNSVDDNGSALVNSIVNYSVEYLRRQGTSPTLLRDAINGTSVQLMYPLGGFSDPNDLTAFGDPNNPTDVGAAELIPVQDYELFLNRSTPTGTLNYSGLVINKTESGYYQVSGYNRVDPFFAIYSANAYGSYKQIGIAPDFYKYPTSFTSSVSVIPYNTTFTSVQAVINFIAGYEQFLVTNGLSFTTNQEQTQVTWESAANQFINWSLTNWGTTIPLSLVLNPSASIIQYSANSGTLYDLTDPLSSLVLDVNGAVVTEQYLDVYRDENSVTVTHQGGGVFSCISADIVSYEHRVVFDNLTAFNDTIYDPISGIRQIRLTFLGQKSANWNGTLDSPGFIICTNNVPDWTPNTDYLFGSLVSWKKNNYVATSDTIGSPTFQYSNFQLISTIFTNSILPNLSLKSVDYLNSYNVNYRPFLTDFMNLRNNTIGYIERDWLTILDIDLGGQIDFYKGWIKEKGTLNSLTSYGRGSTPQLNTNVAIFEEYAMKVGVYGSDLRTGYGDVSLPPSVNTQNPLVISFVSAPNSADANSIQVTPNALYEKSVNWTNDFVQNYGNLQLEESSFLSGGPVIPQELISAAQQSISGFVKTDQPYLFFPTLANITTAPTESVLKIAENGGSFWIENNPLVAGPNQWDVITFNAASTDIASITQVNANTISLILTTNIGAVANSVIIVDYTDVGSNVSISGAFMVSNYIIAPFRTANSYRYSNLLINTSSNQFSNVSINYQTPVTTSSIFVQQSLRSNSIAQGDIESNTTTQYVVNDSTGEAAYNLTRPYTEEITYANTVNGVPITSIAYDDANQIIWYGQPTAVPDGIVQLHTISEIIIDGNIIPSLISNEYVIVPKTPYTSKLGGVVVASEGIAAATAANVGGPGQIYIMQNYRSNAPNVTQILSGDVLSSEYSVTGLAMSEDANWLYAVVQPPSEIAIIGVYSRENTANYTYPIASITSNVSTISVTVGNVIVDPAAISVVITNEVNFSSRILIPNLEYVTNANIIYIPESVGSNIGNANFSTAIYSVNPFFKYQGNIACSDYNVSYTSSSSFGSSISCDQNGTFVAVGAPTQGNGNVLVFTRITENQYQPTSVSIITSVNPFTSVSNVIVNGIEADPNITFNPSNVTLTFSPALPAASTIEIEGFCFALNDIISAPNSTDSLFGSSLAIQNNQLVVGSINTTVGSNYNQGITYFYVLDTSITNSKIVPISDINLSTTPFMINNWVVTPTSANINGLLQGINSVSSYTGISASIQGSNVILSISPSLQSTGVGLLGV